MQEHVCALERMLTRCSCGGAYVSRSSFTTCAVSIACSGARKSRWISAIPSHAGIGEGKRLRVCGSTLINEMTSYGLTYARERGAGGVEHAA